MFALLGLSRDLMIEPTKILASPLWMCTLGRKEAIGL